MAVAERRTVGEAWTITQGRLPDGWTLDGLRCASTGLQDEQRSDDWLAVAVGPAGEERRVRAAEPIAALRGLADGFDPSSEDDS